MSKDTSNACFHALYVMHLLFANLDISTFGASYQIWANAA